MYAFVGHLDVAVLARFGAEPDGVASFFVAAVGDIVDFHVQPGVLVCLLVKIYVASVSSFVLMFPCGGACSLSSFSWSSSHGLIFAGLQTAALVLVLCPEG